MFLSIENLRAGLQWWERKAAESGTKSGKGSAWPSDIHNADYYCIYKARANGTTCAWWKATVSRLQRWGACRARNKPNTVEEFIESGGMILSKVSVQYEKLARPDCQEPCIVDMSWDDVEELYELAASLKNRSPVFASKMCHLLFPKLFVVMDNMATSVCDYELYWRGMKDAWNNFNDKTAAKARLVEAIRCTKSIHLLYPFETRIMELCHIGEKQVRRSTRTQ